MDSAQRRALGLVAVATWLLIDSVRAAGPLLLDLSNEGPVFVAVAAAATALGGALLAWIAGEAARHFGHGGTVAFLLGIVAIFRVALPLLDGGWLTGVGLYLAALAFAGVVLAARVAVGNGGGPALLTGTSLGVAAAIVEQSTLRTYDAVWREDEWGWNAIALLAVLTVINGIRGRDLKPAAGVRGWWAYGLYLSSVLYAFGNLAWINAQIEVRMSTATVLASLGAVLGARLASQSRVLPSWLRAVILALGAGATAVVFLLPGAAAAIAMPVAMSGTTLAAAMVVREGEVTTMRRLGASLLFTCAALTPVGLTVIDRFMVVPGPATVSVLIGALGVYAGAFLVYRPSTPQAALTGVWWRIGVLGACGLAVAIWNGQQYEQPVDNTTAEIAAPHVLTWNLNQGVTPSSQGGPALKLQDMAEALDGIDVALLQEVGRGALLGGGVDMVEYLAGETGLFVSFAPGLSPQVGNAVLTSSPHSDVRQFDLPVVEPGPHRSAVVVESMGMTFASTQLAGSETAASAQAGYLIARLTDESFVIIGGTLADATGIESNIPVLDLFAHHGYDSLARGSATLDGEEVAEVGQMLGRGVTLDEVSVLASPGSDNQPLVAAVTPAP